MLFLRTLVILSICLTFVSADVITCSTTNDVNGLFYNLTGMIRGGDAEDYQYIVSNPDALESVFVNICADAREYCDPDTPVCQESIMNSFPFLATFDSWGSVDEQVFLPYQPNTTLNGVSINYQSQNVSCGDNSFVESFVHVLCDLGVDSGIIDSVTFSDDGCSTDVFMRSKYGCGYDPNEILTCANTTVIEPVACTESGQANFECQTGDFVVSVTGNQNVPKYSFYLASNYTYDYEYNYYSYDENEEYNYEYNGDSSKSIESVKDEENNSTYGGEYKLQFSQFFETDNDGKKSSHSTISLSSLSWEFTQPIVILHDDDDCTQETTFNITNTNPQDGYWSKLVFVNHLYMVDNSSSLKFDVVIEDYEWQDSNSAYLVLSLMYNGGENATVENSTLASTGNSYLYINPTAYSYPNSSNPSINETVQATFTDSGKVEISYSRFTGSLVHDPTFGINLPTPIAPAPPCEDNECTFQSYTVTTSTDSSPKFEFEANNNSNEYTIEFSQLSEVTISDNSYKTVDSSVIDLNDYDWTMSVPKSIVLEDGTAQVSFTVSTGKSDKWSSLSLIFQSSMEIGVTHFYVIIELEDYLWTSNDPSTYLQFDLDMAGEGSIKYSYNTVLVGSGYIQSTNYGTADGGQISNIMLSYSDSAFATISHFDSSISYNLRFGVSSTSDPLRTNAKLESVDGTAELSGDGDDGSSDWWIWLLVAIAGVAVLGVIVAVVSVFIMKNRKRNSYDTME